MCRGTAIARASDIIGKSCSPTTFQWTFNTLSAARSTASAVFEDGAKSWYFAAADYAFGRAMVRDATTVISEKGGKIVGTAWHALGTSDFASYLLQAQGSGAQVVALVSAGSDFINALKHANEFGLTAGGQKIVSMQTFISDIHAIGLPIAQNLTLTAAFYWTWMIKPERGRSVSVNSVVGGCQRWRKRAFIVAFVIS